MYVMVVGVELRIKKNVGVPCSRDLKPTLKPVTENPLSAWTCFSSCGDAVISSPVARGCCSQKDAPCGRLSVKPCQEEFWTSQYPMPCHLTNSVWMGGRTGRWFSHFSSYLAMHCRCCFEFGAPLPYCSREEPRNHCWSRECRRLSKPPHNNQTKMIETRYT
jgi:hypothetical protein